MTPIIGQLAGHTYAFSEGSDATAPPLLLLHGTGGNEHDLIPLASRLAPGSPLLSPRGNVNESGSNRFFRRFGEGVFDLNDVRDRTAALAEFIAAASLHHHFRAGSLIALGFSNGANIAATLLQLHPTALGGAILLRPMVVLDEPAAADSLTGKRVLIASGNHDPLVTADHPVRLAAHLQSGGAKVTLHTSTAGHGLVSADIESAQAFLNS